MYKFISVCLLCLWWPSSFSESPNTFAQAKKIAAKIFLNHKKTLYCQCTYETTHQINLKSCSMMDAEEKKRAHYVEWEHIMAAENFGQHFECWRKPLCEKNGKPFRGRRCCQMIDSKFRHLESELYNLWPAVGLVNQARSNYRFGFIEDKKSFYGCPIAIDKKLRRAEPPDFAKGIVARANLFVSEHYEIPLSESQRQLFHAWDKLFPATAWKNSGHNQ